MEANPDPIVSELSAMPFSTSTRRRWFAVSLRATLLFIAIIAGVCGVIRRWNVTVVPQRRAIAMFEAKFDLKYDWQLDEAEEPKWPDWVRAMQGDDLRRHIVEIRSQQSFIDPPGPTPDLDDEQIVAINGLTSLRELDLWNHDLKEEQIERIQLPQLQSLTLRVRSDLDAFARDGTLQKLDGFPALKSLIIFDRRIYAHKLGSLKRMPQLEKLVLRGTIDDEGLQQLATLKQLQSLHVVSRIQDDQSLACLKSLPKLTALGLDLSNCGSQAAEHVAACQSLTHLSLRVSRSWGDGMRHIAAMPQLADLDLSWSELTREQLEVLATNPRLTSLDLYMTSGVGDDDLLLAFKNSPNLHSITLEGLWKSPPPLDIPADIFRVWKDD